MTDDLMSDNWDDDCATITISDLTYTIPIVIFGKNTSINFPFLQLGNIKL